MKAGRLVACGTLDELRREIERLERAFVIGYGTGVTTGELAALEETRTVSVAEISHGVIEAAPLFDEGNLRASRSPKVSLRRLVA